MRSLVFGITLLFLSSGTAFPAVVAEQVVAIVNGQLLFQSDLVRNQIFFKEEPNTVQDLIHHKLLLLEAKRFILSPPEEEEVDLSFKALQQQFPDETAFNNVLKETGLTIEGLKREIMDHVWVKKLIRDRITFFIFITDQEVAHYYEQHQEINEGEDKVRAILEKEKEAIKIKEYLARITSQANIEINVR